MKIFKYVILGAILMTLFACENEKILSAIIRQFTLEVIKNRMQRQTPLSSRSKNMMMRYNLMI